MHLYALPLLFSLAGLVLYVVLGGADFGAGFWQLVAGRGERAERIREHAHNSMAPVWEANHVWLIFVLVVMWTCYPEAFASIASTLAIPLFAAAIGIVFRGASYALRAGTSSARELTAIDTVFAISSVITPFALGTVVGGIASGRVPVGNAAGDLWTSWFNATSLTIGVLAVVFSAYISGVFLAADAARNGDAEMEEAFRARAIVAGVIAGVVAAGALFVVHQDARMLYDELVHGSALVVMIVSGLAGAATIALVWQRRYEWSRYSAAGAVTAVIVAWAIAQSPRLLPGLPVRQAAAPHDTLVATVVAVVGGAVILFPSLALLFTLTLRGRLGHAHDEEVGTATGLRALASGRAGLLTRVAIACGVAALGFLTVAESGWAHAVGVVLLVAFVVTGFLAAVPLDEPTADEPESTAQRAGRP
jgi:cytochrome d ubiquinol oxidase subunit II